MAGLQEREKMAHSLSCKKNVFIHFITFSFYIIVLNFLTRSHLTAREAEKIESYVWVYGCTHSQDSDAMKAGNDCWEAMFVATAICK